MKSVFSTLLTLMLSLMAFAQGQPGLTGAFHAKDGNTHHLWLFQDGYSSYIQYEDHKYLGTWGGPFSFQNQQLSVQVEYNDQDSAAVGTRKDSPAILDQDQLKIGNLTFERQKPIKQDLDGLWRITGRKEGEKVNNIPRGDRKTIKLLVDGYFQWIAINPATKGFYGTGGGLYRFDKGKYTETIVFFSRDNSRVAAKLSFDGALKEGAWQHSGLSSKGDPIFEIWSRDRQ